MVRLLVLLGAVSTSVSPDWQLASLSVTRIVRIPQRFWLISKALEDYSNPYASCGAIRYNRRTGIGSHEYPVLADAAMGIRGRLCDAICCAQYFP